MIESFPFVIKNFHSDCGSEYINRHVAEMLEKLRIEQTKSRARHCNHNALVESKNASTVRKYLGYAHIPASLADLVSKFTQVVLTPYINYRRLPLMGYKLKIETSKHLEVWNEEIEIQ